MKRGREVLSAPQRLRRQGLISQDYLTPPVGGLADFLSDPASAKASGRLPLAPPSRPRGFEG